ncbi:hypothetical protein [Methylobacterium sp. sgz302541]|uniref:hypothetical protein n=1 Tax=unclassified Methylobacterium TaxID=2615210 RepID=UPI003D33C1FB
MTLRSQLRALSLLGLLGLPVAGPALAEEGNVLTNLLKYGGTTVPPSRPKDVEPAYCPPIDVPEGGAALQTFAGRSGDASAIRTQVTLGRLARECTRLQDGSLTVKVGVEGRVLLGPSGKPGRVDVPVTVAIKRGEAVLVSRTRRVSATVPSGEAQGFFSLVEDALPVPVAASEDYDIVVGLGGGGAARASAKSAAHRRRPAAVAAPADAGAGAAQ